LKQHNNESHKAIKFVGKSKEKYDFNIYENRANNLFIDTEFLVKSADGRRSIDRSKIKVRKSLIQSYRKAQTKSTVDLKKMYDEFIKQKESLISVNQIKRKYLCNNRLAPSTLDINTPKSNSIKNKSDHFIRPELMQDLDHFKVNKKSPVKLNVKNFDTRNIDKVWQTLRKNKLVLLK
jgi:hypothetical protein